MWGMEITWLIHLSTDAPRWALTVVLGCPKGYESEFPGMAKGKEEAKHNGSEVIVTMIRKKL